MRAVVPMTRLPTMTLMQITTTEVASMLCLAVQMLRPVTTMPMLRMMMDLAPMQQQDLTATAIA